MTRRAKVHLDATTAGAVMPRGLCGTMTAFVTADRGQVTCKLCRARMAKRESVAELRDEYSHAGSFIAATEKPLPQSGPWDPRVHRLWVEVFRGIADVIAPSVPTPMRPPIATKRDTPFRSVRQALAQLVQVRVDGYGQRSISDPERLQARTGALGGPTTSSARDDRAAAQADHVVHVERAFIEAYTRPWDGDAVLTPEVCRLILVMRHVARTGRDRALTSAEVAERIAERVSEPDRERITPRLVARIARYGYARVHTALASRQLVEPDEELEGTGTVRSEGGADTGEDQMSGGEYLDGWKAIATHLGVHEDTARRWAGEGMPTYLFRGKVQAQAAELDAWVASQRVPRSSAPPARKVGT